MSPAPPAVDQAEQVGERAELELAVAGIHIRFDGREEVVHARQLAGGDGRLGLVLIKRLVELATEGQARTAHQAVAQHERRLLEDGVDAGRVTIAAALYVDHVRLEAHRGHEGDARNKENAEQRHHQDEH